MEAPSFVRLFKDSTAVEVVDEPDELAIRCRVTSAPLGWLLPILFFTAWTLIAWHLGGGWDWTLVGLFAMGSWIWHWWQPVDVQLLVTSRGFETRGNFGGGYSPVRQMLWNDVIRIEYSVGTGGEDEYSPRGLWAVCVGFSTCLLPGLDLEETTPIISRIYERFPNAVMAKDSGYQGIFRDELISLGLSQPKDAG